MDINIEELARLAELATPGPWFAGNWTEFSDGRRPRKNIPRDDPFWSHWVSSENGEPVILKPEEYDYPSTANAAFIAAANPTVVLELIAMYRAAKAAYDRVGKISQSDLTDF